MPRVKRGVKARRRRKRILKRAKGFRGGRSRLIRTATEAVDRAMAYATKGRKLKKRDFRKLWVIRIASAVKAQGLSYSKFMGALKKASVEIDRKMLSELAVRDPKGFAKVVEVAKSVGR